MDQINLKALIESSKRNDHQSFRTIVEGHQPMVYGLAFRLLCNEDDAKDLVQETFIRVWMNLKSFDTSRKFTTWVYTIATNLCMDKLRATKRKVQVDENLHELMASEDLEQRLIDRDLGRIILVLTDQLTPKQKVVFTLRDLEGLEVDEIMQITGLTANKIKSNLFLARQTLRKCLNNL